MKTESEESHKTTHVQTDRYKIIDSIISSGKTTPFEEILKQLREKLSDRKCSASTLHRDLKYMHDSLGAPLCYDRKQNGYYYNEPYNLPINSLSSKELEKLAIVKKLLMQFDSDDSIFKDTSKLLEKLFPSSDALEFMNRIVIPKRPKPVFEKKTCDDIMEAIHNNYFLDFSYVSKWEPGKNHRRVMPYQLVIDQGQLYLYAADFRDEKATRLYNICRIHELSVQRDTHFELPKNYRFVEDFECGRWGAFQYDETYSYKIEFYGEARNYIHERVWADDQTLVEDYDNEITTMTFTSSQWIQIEHWLLSFGENARPVEPDWLVKDWKKNICGMNRKNKQNKKTRRAKRAEKK